MQSKYTLSDLIIQWLYDNDYKFEYEDYSDFILLYVNTPSTTIRPSSRLSPGRLARLSLGRGSWATGYLDSSGEKRGIMVLRDKVQIGCRISPIQGISSGVDEIMAWDPNLFEKLKEYLA